MEENANFPTTRATGIRFGLFLAVISIAYFLIMTLLGVDMSAGLARWGMWVVTIVMLVLAHKYFKDNGDGFMSYGQGVGIGFWAGLVSSVVSSIFTFIYVSFIDSSFIANIIRKAEEDMQAQGKTQAEIDMAMPWVEKFTTPVALLAMGLIFGILMAVFIALIVSIFTQKQAPREAV